MASTGLTVRAPRWLLALVAAVVCAVLPASAHGRDATAALGLSDSAGDFGCLLAAEGCPAPDVRHALFDRFQALSSDRTAGANSFRYVRGGIPWDAVSSGGIAIGTPCTAEMPPPLSYGVPWIALVERYVLAARRAGLDPLIAITDNSAARYPGNGNAHDPANPTANQYRCGFRGIVSALDAFAARERIAPPTEYEVYDEPDGAHVSNACNPTPDGSLPAHSAEQCAAWYYYEADAVNRESFGNRLTLVALAADGDSANDPNLIAIKAYADYLTGTIGLHPAVWSFHPYEDLSAAGYRDNGAPADSDTSSVSAYIASLYRSRRAKPQVWLTEVAAQLTDPVPSYFGRMAGCHDGEADDPTPYTLGGCLDGNPKAQAYAADDFLQLARAGAAFPGEITRMYWHQFDSAAAHPTTWDSGIVSPGDHYERTSYCVLAGETVTEALADPGCNSAQAAEDSEDSADGYPETDAAAGGQAALATCPQPWCSFSLIRLRLTELTLSS